MDGQDPATIDRQVSTSLLADVVKQIGGPQPALSPSMPWRIMGLFPSSCMVCRATGVCGPISCAEKVGAGMGRKLSALSAPCCACRHVLSCADQQQFLSRVRSTAPASARAQKDSGASLHT